MTPKFLKNKEKHTFHLVKPSQLPLIISIGILAFLLSIVAYFHKWSGSFYSGLFHISTLAVFYFLFTWFKAVMTESTEGNHTLAVRQGLRYGMALFIVSEVLFFFAFFWGFFHFSLSPSVAIGCIWPPKSSQPLDIWGLPLWNTLLLLSSGVTITLAHNALLRTKDYSTRWQFLDYLALTIIFGNIFLVGQLIEYDIALGFSWKDNVYGTTFYVTTGFHAAHVTIGIIWLYICFFTEITTGAQPLNSNSLFYKFLVKFSGLKKSTETPLTLRHVHRIQNSLSKYVFTKDQHLAFELAAWYWHFVDVVWLFLFLSIYWWGS